MSGMRSRTFVILAVGMTIAAFMLYAFWPRALSVDVAIASKGPLVVTIDEEAKTRVRNSYIVSAPVSGRLMRVEVEAGDEVIKDRSLVAQIMPAAPTALDVRTESQARAAIEAAEAAVTLARAEVRRATADADYARAQLDRSKILRASDTVSAAALEQAERAERAANAALATAQAAVGVREADLESARALLQNFDDINTADFASPVSSTSGSILYAPISGRVLRIFQESETVAPAGTPILEIGDPSDDLEIVAEFLTTDAVRISPGDRVIIDRWGGDEALDGRVDRIEPLGFTKHSALGVEEQRVNVIVRFNGESADHARLGHGFRVEVRVVTWESDDTLTIPASAIFRDGETSQVFVVDRGKARLVELVTGNSNGLKTEIIDGLNEGDAVVLYPGNRITEGTRVK